MNNCQRLTLEDTNVLKGVALLLLLFHHLFCYDQGLYHDIRIGDVDVVLSFSRFSKLCVAIFVFLSGYGLTCRNLGGVNNLKSFYWRRFVRLFLNYWLIFILFVPVGVLVFDRSFSSVYGDSWQFKLVIDFFGMSKACGFFGYNPTWWFYSCIIWLYFLFPFLMKGINRPVLLVMIGAVVYISQIPGTGSFSHYLLTFVVGMICAHEGLPSDLGKVGNMLIIPILLFLCIHRNDYDWYSKMVDALICPVLCVIYIQYGNHIGRAVKKTLRFIGKHSFNIFLFHTFIFSLYFHDFIYFSKNPIVIYALLLFICLIISITIDWIKIMVGLNKLQTYLLNIKL